MAEADITIIAATVVQLAQMAVVAYGIGSVKAYLIHWLDTRTTLLFPRTPEEIATDAARHEGRGIIT